MTPSPQEVTRLLLEWHNGDQAALDKLMPLVYQELRWLARRYMSREGPGHLLQATALVNEAYLRLTGEQSTEWQNRAHFFAVAARVMRHLLVDHARGLGSAKRGGGRRQASLDEAPAISSERADELLALDEALEHLAAVDPRKSQIVEMRYFSGMTSEETAEVLDLSPTTVTREWVRARAFLLRELSGGRQR